MTGVNGPFSKAAAKGFRNGMQNAGVDIAGFSLYPLDADRSSIVSKAKSTNPDIHLNTGNIDSNVKFMQAAKQAGYSPDGIGQHYGINTPGYKNLGATGNYTFGASMWLPQAGRSGGALWGDSQSYTKQFKQAYDKSPEYTEAASSATGVVYQQALAKLGSAPPLDQSSKNKLISILEKISVDTFWGTIDYKSSGSNYHNNVKTQPLTIQLDKDLNAKIINPAGASDYKPVYPMPNWEKR